MEDKILTMGQHPGELSEHDQKLADTHKLHVHIDGGSHGVDQTDQDHLEENL